MKLSSEEIKEKVKKIEKLIKIKETESREIWEEIRKEKDNPKEKIIESLKGIKRTTGQHPGGLLITLPDTKIQDYTPLNYPADNRTSDWTTTHFEYSFLSDIFLKVDILGHDEPTILQKLFQSTGVDPMEIPFKDPEVMKIFTNADTIGIPEFGTDFVRKNLLSILKPTKFSQLVQISGFSHGTNVWLQNQQIIHKGRLLKLDQLIACREDIWKFLSSWGVDNKNAFIATEYIRKGKWERLSEDIKKEMKSKLKDKEGDLYFSILSKIKYIFPKPHAISYTKTAWRAAFYKKYHQKEFYSVLLTYHATIYDIWLMNLNPDTITFRINELLNNVSTYKNYQKDLVSIIKVLGEFNKEIKKVQKKKDSEGDSFSSEKLKKMNLEKVLNDFEEKIKEAKNDNLKSLLQESKKSWKMTAKEKGLLFTLKVILEMEMENLGFKKGVDFNESEVKSFKIKNETIYFPFTAVNGIGEKVAEKIVCYRNNNKRIKFWEEELNNILNINHIQQIKDLEKHDLIIT